MNRERKTLEFETTTFMHDIRTLTKVTSLRDIASVIDVSASTLSRLDNGHVPDMETFMRICQNLELQPDKYFNWYIWKLEKKSASLDLDD